MRLLVGWRYLSLWGQTWRALGSSSPLSPNSNTVALLIQHDQFPPGVSWQNCPRYQNVSLTLDPLPKYWFACQKRKFFEDRKVEKMPLCSSSRVLAWKYNWSKENHTMDLHEQKNIQINVTFYNEETKKRQNSFATPNSFVNFQWELISISIAFQNYFSYGVFSLFNPQPRAMIFSFQILLLQSHAFTCLCNIQTFESKQKCFSIFLSEHNCSVGQS